MREFKAAILLALVLAFVGGLGAGAWIGSLRAAPQTPRRSVDRRLESWKERYELTPSQERRLREVLIRYDKGRDRVRAQMDAERWTHVDKLRRKAHDDIQEILHESAPAVSVGGG
ncbi:MAG: hypothetical protein ACYTGZ_04660 [Planctomycetota bacterium]|jgi:hypothetical protein